MKYKCLVLDHDDTVVRSTESMHYPSFLETINLLRPEIKISLEQFRKYCFEPGFFEMCTDILKFSENEMEIQYDIWKKNTDNITPEFFDNILDVIYKFKSMGGIITVVSHSSVEMINKHYRNKTNIIPDMVFGYDSKHKKPHPYPLLEIMKKFKLEPEEIVVIDDLKPGYDMALKVGVDFIWAGWAHQIDQLINFMKKNANHCVYRPVDLHKLLF